MHAAICPGWLAGAMPVACRPHSRSCTVRVACANLDMDPRASPWHAMAMAVTCTRTMRPIHMRMRAGQRGTPLRACKPAPGNARRRHSYYYVYTFCCLTPTLLWRLFMSSSEPPRNGRSTPARSYCTKAQLTHTHMLGVELGSLSFCLTGTLF
jgi:hypothetical protein